MSQEPLVRLTNLIFPAIHGSQATPHNHPRSPVMTFIFCPSLTPYLSPQPVMNLNFFQLQTRASAHCAQNKSSTHFQPLGHYFFIFFH